MVWEMCGLVRRDDPGDLAPLRSILRLSPDPPMRFVGFGVGVGAGAA